jgi:hypothetical protein
MAMLLVLVTAAVPAALTQSGRVEVADSGAKELKRTAHRLRMPVENLRKARAVLEEATELARRPEIPMQSAAMLGFMWVQYQRSAAPAKLELLLAGPRRRAQEADDLAAYKAAITAAQPTLAQLAEVDAERATELASQWPAPPRAAGPEGEEARRGMEATFRRMSAERLGYRDPEQAMTLLEGGGATEGTQFMVLAQLAGERYRDGRKDEALKLADRALADFERRAPGRNTFDYGTFIDNLARIDTGRALAAFEVLARSDAGPPLGGDGTPWNVMPQLRTGAETIPLTWGEATLITALQRIRTRPELSMRAIATIPSLQAKVEKAGGVDALLGFDPSTGMAGSAVTYASPESAAQQFDPSAANRLWLELRSRPAKDSSLVEKILSEKGTDPMALLMLAQRASIEDPSLAALALAKATPLVMRQEPMERRASSFRMLLSASRMLEGEVDPGLFVQGFRFVQEMRASERDTPETAEQERRRRAMGLTGADMFEAWLLGEYARVDFEAALGLIRRLPDPTRLFALVQIAQTLRMF